MKITDGRITIEDKNSDLFVTVEIAKGTVILVDPKRAITLSAKFPRSATKQLAQTPGKK